MNYVFDARELDPFELKSRARAEWEEISLSEYKLRGRTKKELLKDCLRGHAAELWLIHKGYEDDDRKYRDVKDTQGEPVEIKVVQSPSVVHYTIDRCSRRKRSMEDGYASKVYVFINHPAETDYYFHGVYQWDPTERVFKPTTRKIEDIE